MPDRWRDLSVYDYARQIIEKKPFQLAGWGDTEWGALLGYCGTDCNGVEYGPYLGSLLVETLTRPVGVLQAFSPGPKLEEEAHEWLGRAKDKNVWVRKSTLPAANSEGKLAPFLRALRTRPVWIVGPDHLRQLPKSVVGHVGLSVVKDYEAWQQTAEIRDVVHHALSKHGDLVVLFAAGSASNIVIHEVTDHIPFATLIDVGAILDPYVGEFSRNRYRYTENLNANLRANLEP